MRLGVRVSGYKRGSGKGTPRASRMVGNPKEDSSSIGLHGFVFNFKYSDKPGDGETVTIFSDDYENAQDEAFEERKDTRIPMEIESIDPPVKDVLKTILSGAKKATKIGGKYTIRAGKAVAGTGTQIAKESYSLATFEAQRRFIESLLKLCYQKDKAKRIAARTALKSRYPEVYKKCDFSRPERPQRRTPPRLVRFPQRYVS